jgi:glycerol kinase
MGFQADLSDVPVDRPAVIETTAFGAACLAGLATGVWPDQAALASVRATERVFLPTMGEPRRALLVAGWKSAVRRTLSEGQGSGEGGAPG